MLIRPVSLQSEIFNALEKTRLLVADDKESQYSRCGRTDKGFPLWVSKLRVCTVISKNKS